MSSTDLNRMSATALAALLQRREVRAEQVVRACLERIAGRDATIGAWVHCDGDAVLAQAQALDAGPVRGPLHGLPVGVKDIIATCDMPTQYGSPIYAGHRPAWDAAVVAWIRAAGGIVLGKTATTEFASFPPAKTVNPLDTAHTPGGSSSGSAAAVADCMVPFALGTQTAGSVIRPASFCGIVGFKPSFGAIDRHGVKPLSESLDTVGVLARTVADAALLFAGITGRQPLPDQEDGRVPRIGLCRSHQWPHASAETRRALEHAARELQRAGARVEEVELPAQFADLEAAHPDIEHYDMARSLAHERQYHPGKLTPALLERIEQGATITPERYDACIALAQACRRTLPEVLGGYDALLTPSAPSEAPQGLSSTGNAIFNKVWTLLRVPCATVPAALGPSGLPVGVQLVGPARGDRALLSIARWVESRLPPPARASS